MIMRDTIFCAVPPDSDLDAISASVRKMVADVSSYVPGYRLLNDPQFDETTVTTSTGTATMARVSIFVEVEGAGDYLAPYAGNLDIMTAAAAAVGDAMAQALIPAQAAEEDCHERG
jgi:acetaldehyde dehydrogenase